MPTPARAAPVQSIAQRTRLGDDPKVDAEWSRFLSVAITTPNGLGLYDPAFSAEMPSGIPGADWAVFVVDCRNLGKAVRT